MKKTPLRKISNGQRERNKKKAEETEELHELFRTLWDEREDEEGNVYCFETGIAMHGSIYRSRTTCYHHVLPKGEGAYPQYSKNKKNIVIIHPNVHAKVEGDIDSCPKVKEYREYLLSLHYANKLEKEDNG